MIQPATLTTIPQELRDVIYQFLDDASPHQCRLCGLVVYNYSGNDCILTTYTSDTLLLDDHSDRDSTYQTFSSPYIIRPCHVKTNPGHDIRANSCCGHAHRVTFLRLNASDFTPLHHHKASNLRIGLEQSHDSAQATAFPPLVHVNKQLRAEILSTIFLKNRLYATIFRVKSDMAAIGQRLRALGPEGVSMIENLYIVSSKKKDHRRTMKELIPSIEAAGVRVAEGVVKVLRLMKRKIVPSVIDERLPELAVLPGRKCEYCILQFLRIEDRKMRGVKSTSLNTIVRAA